MTLLVPLLLVAAPVLVEHAAPVMGTELVVKVAVASESDRPRVDEAFAAVRAEFERLEILLSEWKPDSPLGRLNARKDGNSVVLPPEAFDLLVRTFGWSRRTDGAFDPTFASLWGLWRFDPGDEKRIPSPEDARKRAGLIDWRKVVLDPKKHTVSLPVPGMKLGLGGIAKGFAVDRAVNLLRARGFENFFVKAGGELYLGGTKGERPWVVGIQDPRDRSRWFATLEVKDSAFTTSGDYERFLIHDGVRYHHIIDPATGYPARKCRSATILAPRAEDADALSTSVFVLGPKKGLALVESLPGVEAVIVSAEGKVLVSSGLRGRIELQPLTPWDGP